MDATEIIKMVMNSSEFKNNNDFFLSNLQKFRKELDEEIRNIREQMEKFASENERLDQKRAELESECSRLKSDKLKLEYECSQLKSDRASLEVDLKSKVQDIRDAQFTIKGLQEKVSEFEKKNENYEQRCGNLEKDKEDLERNQSNLENKLQMAKRQIEHQENELQELDKFVQAKKLFDVFNSLSDSTKKRLEGIFASNSFEGFISNGVQFDNISVVWEFIKRKIIDKDTVDIDKLLQIFKFFFELYNLGFQLPRYVLLEPKVGDDFDRNSSANIGTATNGVVSEVLMPGYKDLKTEVVKKAMVLVE